VNYQKIIDQIVDRGKLRGLPRVRPKGFERHHILPCSFGGTNKKSNLVDLTPREHFIVHHLLARIHGGKMSQAWWMMCHQNSKTGFKPNSRQYETAKRLFSKIITGNSFACGKRSKEQCENIKRSVQNFYDNLTDSEREERSRIQSTFFSELHKGVPKSENHREIISKCMIEVHANSSIEKKQSRAKKISIASKGHPGAPPPRGLTKDFIKHIKVHVLEENTLSKNAKNYLKRI